MFFLGLYGMLFRRNKEAAFSNYRLWESAGFVIAYAYSTTLCARMKLYVLFGNLAIGVFCYVIVEVRHRRKVNSGINITYLQFCNFLNNRNEDLRNKKQEMKQPVKQKQHNMKLKRQTMNVMTWKRILKLRIFN